MKDFKEAAEKYADEFLKMHGWSEDSNDAGMLIAGDFIAGAHHGYSEAMKEHRAVYHAMRKYFQILDGSPGDQGSAVMLKVVEQEIRMKLQAFTDHEQNELPFTR